MDGAEIKSHFLLALMIVMTTDPTICFVSLDSLSPSQLYSLKTKPCQIIVFKKLWIRDICVKNDELCGFALKSRKDSRVAQSKLS